MGTSNTSDALVDQMGTPGRILSNRPPSLVGYIPVTGSSSLGLKIGPFILTHLVLWGTVGLPMLEKLYYQQEPPEHS